ncbi:flagellar basal body L-ring protein FlgH [Comamonas aquatica]|uniref:flagellar basal body L-ring protein FlgH n=1 Tax=Comamonas aquatica TaxID=225991 RepID=UPI0009F49998|nr:flagellar basal body L-ring protein FlgH [Comamonas aquatica]
MSAASRPSSQVFALAQRTPRIALWGAASLVISGCAFNDPPPVDLQSQTHPLPATAIAVPQQQAQATGGLFQANRYRPPFESRRARLVGDMVTIQIAERVTASQQSSSNVKRDSNMSAGITDLPVLTGGALATAQKFGKLGVGSNADFEGGGGTTSANTFTGSITATVVEVLPNGHLVVTGEKQIGVNQNVDVLRFTGTVDPYQLQPNSVISSTQVANVRVESRGRGQQNSAQAIGWLSRFFLSFIPF